jgi:hypothetical protein
MARLARSNLRPLVSEATPESSKEAEETPVACQCSRFSPASLPADAGLSGGFGLDTDRLRRARIELGPTLRRVRYLLPVVGPAGRSVVCYRAEDTNYQGGP